MDPLLSDLNVLTLSNNYEMQDDIDCHSWLLEIDLLQYLETFLTNLSNDGRVIRRKRLNQLRQQDLSSMNITNYVHQKMLMEHIRLVQKYSFHSPLRKKELKPITVTSSKILSFGNNEKVDKQNDKKKNKPKTSLVPTQEKMITSNSIAVDKKKQNRRRRSFDSEAWNSIINMRNRADQNANKADLLRDGVYSKSDFNESKVGSQDSKYETKQQQVPSNDGSSKRRNTKSNRRHSFNGIDPEEAVRKDMVSGERAKAKIYGNMALEYDIMLSHLHTLQGEILHKFKATINCEVASIFFVNHTTQELLLCGADFKWYKIPCGVGVCGYCFKTGENVNIPDAYADYRFNSNMDKKTNFKTRNILCQPIRSHRGGGPIIGIIQMLNKLGDADSFDQSDEELLSAFIIQIADLLHMRFSELIDLADKFSGQAIFVGGKGGEMLNKINYASDTATSKANALPVKEYK